MPCKISIMAKNYYNVIRKLRGPSNKSQFVTPAPYPVRGRLRRESSYVKSLWIPAFAGMTFLEDLYILDYLPATVKATLTVTYYFRNNGSRNGANMYSWTL
jgi:hypothetical protein